MRALVKCSHKNQSTSNELFKLDVKYHDVTRISNALIKKFAFPCQMFINTFKLFIFQIGLV